MLAAASMLQISTTSCQRKLRASSTWTAHFASGLIISRSGCSASGAKAMARSFRSFFSGALIFFQHHTLSIIHVHMYSLKEPKVKALFWDACRQIWALHKLVRGFPVEPELIRFTPGERVDPSLCKSYFGTSAEEDESAPAQVDTSALEVVCTVLPGFQIDGFTHKCDILWA